MSCYILTCLDFRCTADCGWITGHSYVTYGPLLNGASVVVYEGVWMENLLSSSTISSLDGVLGRGITLKVRKQIRHSKNNGNSCTKINYTFSSV